LVVVIIVANQFRMVQARILQPLVNQLASTLDQRCPFAKIFLSFWRKSLLRGKILQMLKLLLKMDAALAQIVQKLVEKRGHYRLHKRRNEAEAVASAASQMSSSTVKSLSSR